MLEKLKNLLNLKAWAEGFVGKMIVQKGVKHAVTALLGLLGTAAFQAKVAPILTALGVTIDPAQLAVGLTGFFSAAAGFLINWGLKVAHLDSPAQTV